MISTPRSFVAAHVTHDRGFNMNDTLRRPAFALLVFAALLAACRWSGARAADSAGDRAPDFPPGAFNDGGRYRLSDFEGKVLVLFFYEQDCPRCRGSIKD